MAGTESEKSTVAFFWDLYINGTLLPLERKKCIQSLEYANPIDAADSLNINVHDPDMEFIQDDLFVEDAVVKCDIYFEGVEDKITFDGYLVGFDPDFPEDGCPTVKLYCVDKTHLMDKTKVKKTWKNMTRADIIKAILKKYGYTLKVESGYTFRKVKSVAQSNVTDIAFIFSLVQAEPDLFFFKLQGTTGFLRRYIVAGNYDRIMGYRTAPYDILNFQPQITKAKIEVKEKESKIDPVSGDEWATTTTAEEQGVPSGTTSPTGSDSTTNTVYNRETGEWEYIN